MSTPEFFNRFCLFGALALLFNASVFAEERAVPTTYSSWLDAVNVPYVWNLGFTGQNAVVGIIDDSVDMDHPFFGSQIDRGLAYNTGVLYNDPVFKEFLPTLPTQSPNDTSAVWERATVLYNGASKEAISDNDCHGTSVTGCIAAYDSATNTYGSAYNATLVPIRIDFACQNFMRKSRRASRTGNSIWGRPWFTETTSLTSKTTVTAEPWDTSAPDPT